VSFFRHLSSQFLIKYFLLFIHFFTFFFSGVYATAETKGRQTLLRHQANHIADYEALHHIHFWQQENDPKYIYYFGQSKNFEEWYTTRKDQGPIYKELESKSTFTKHVFRERSFDDHSIWVWVYDDNFKSEIKEIIIMKNELNEKIERLTKKIHDPKKKDDDDEIKKKIKELDNIKIKDLEI
jgi:hypothetical protein